MPWDDTARAEYARPAARYASDLTDREWELIEPFLPADRRLGRPRTTDLREVLNAILYLASTGCQWRMLPKDFPPVSTVQGYFYAWRDARLWTTINHALVMAAREAAGCEASPTAGVIPSRRMQAVACQAADSQSVKTTEAGGVSEWSCPGVGGNSRAAFSAHCDFGLIQRPGQGRRAVWVGKASPIRRPCAW